jgi:hypothetical protein
MSLQTILASAFNTLATRGSIRASGYAVPTSACTSIDRLSSGDRILAALWVTRTVEKTLDAVSRAFITAKYTGPSKERDSALDVLTAAILTARVNPELMRAVVEREFIVGETYCPSTVKLGKDHGTSHVTAWKYAERVRLAIIEIGNNAYSMLKPAFESKGYC